MRAAAERVELGGLLDRRPQALSGGQRQRVALGRAIVRTPKLFLMDEPLSNLDAKLRVQMRAQIKHLQREIGVTTIYVTHDQVEAMTLADRVAVMSQGRLQQVGAPLEIYNWPRSVFVAGFLGNPSMNLVQGEVVEGRLPPSGVLAAGRRGGGRGGDARAAAGGHARGGAGGRGLQRRGLHGGAARRQHAGHDPVRRRI